MFRVSESAVKKGKKRGTFSWLRFRELLMLHKGLQGMRTPGCTGMGLTEVWEINIQKQHMHILT